MDRTLTKKELSLQIEKKIQIYENENTLPNEKIDALEKTIELCDTYRSVYKDDYKHRFYGNIIKFSTAMLMELRKMLNDLKFKKNG